MMDMALVIPIPELSALNPRPRMFNQRPRRLTDTVLDDFFADPVWIEFQRHFPKSTNTPSQPSATTPMEEDHKIETSSHIQLTSNTSDQICPKVTSAMCEALDSASEEPWSILNFGMKVLKPEEKAKQDQEEWENLQELAEDNIWTKAKEDHHKAEQRKQGSKERQKKSRYLRKQREIQAGERSPGGTK